MYDDTDDRNLRYVGENPNNYIDIGDRDGDGQPILWRIIGVMKNVTNAETNKEEDLIKIIRADSIGQYSWDYSHKPRVTEEGNYEYYEGDQKNMKYGINDWNEADLMKLLNPDTIYNKTYELGSSLYWNKESGEYNTKEIFVEGIFEVDFTNDGISEEAREKIAKVRWNLGSISDEDIEESYYIDTPIYTPSSFYQDERGDNNGDYCLINGGECSAEGCSCDDNIERKNTWDGYIGLLYPSDIGYAVGGKTRDDILNQNMIKWGNYELAMNNWLYLDNLATISPVEDNTYASMIWSFVHSTYTLEANFAYEEYDIYPVAYLKSSISITDAAGTQDDPFVAS